MQKEMKLFEILNTKQPITWKVINNSTIGSFTFDDNNIDINLDEYDIKRIYTKHWLNGQFEKLEFIIILLYGLKIVKVGLNLFQRNN